MKPDIHPTYVETTVTCTCGNTFTTRSTAKNGVIHADVCSECHPFYTGKQKILDTGGRVARFEKRFGKKAGSRLRSLLDGAVPESVRAGAVVSFQPGAIRPASEEAVFEHVAELVAEHADLERAARRPRRPRRPGRRPGGSAAGTRSWARSSRPTATGCAPAAT